MHLSSCTSGSGVQLCHSPKVGLGHVTKSLCTLYHSCACMHSQSLSHVLPFVTPWTVARQAPLSMAFSRQETGVGCHSLLQGIFLTCERPNLRLLCLLHCQVDSVPLHHLRSLPLTQRDKQNLPYRIGVKMKRNSS